MKFSIHGIGKQHKTSPDHARINTHTGTGRTSILETVVNFARLFAQVEKIQDLLTTAEKAATS
jgi:hypothetical protein